MRLDRRVLLVVALALGSVTTGVGAALLIDDPTPPVVRPIDLDRPSVDPPATSTTVPDGATVVPPVMLTPGPAP
ncbi:MAG: hypothetical protein ACXW2C_09445, partial [Acidimicrobiia bacterium]